MSPVVAAIDCGTNSIRLLVARRGEDGGLRDLERAMEIVRLGYGVDRTGRLDPAAIERTLAATRRFAAVIEARGAEHVRFVATSATRDAADRDVFVDGVRAILGIEPEVVTGQEEAELSYAGAVTTLPGLGRGPRLVVDIGGGSTELVLGSQRPEHRISLDIGAVRMTERHLRSDPPTPAEITAATADIEAQLDAAARVVPLEQARTLIGVAGTVTTVTALALGLERYSPEATHGAELPMSEAAAVCAWTLRSSRAERARHGAIHPGRVDVLGGGALIWERVLHRLSTTAGLTTARTSEHDILDGIALAMLQRG